MIDTAKLFRAILRDAIFVLCDGGGGARNCDQLRADAREWVLDSESKDVFSFRTVCDVLDVDHAVIRDAILRRALPINIVVRRARTYRKGIDPARVLALMADGRPLREIAAELGCSITTVSILSKGARTKYIHERNRKIKQRYADGASIKALMAETKLSYTQLQRIIGVGRPSFLRSA